MRRLRTATFHTIDLDQRGKGYEFLLFVEASPAQRAGWRVMPFGDAIEWQEIDEHVSVKGLLRGEPAPGAKPPGGGR